MEIHNYIKLLCISVQWFSMLKIGCAHCPIFNIEAYIPRLAAKL